MGRRRSRGAGKPVVRGEGGIDSVGGPEGELPELAQDTRGVWLHTLLWGTLDPGGLYELYWWTDNIRRNDLYFQFRARSATSWPASRWPTAATATPGAAASDPGDPRCWGRPTARPAAPTCGPASRD